MQAKKEQLSPTSVKLTITADAALMNDVKHEVLTHLAKDHVKIQGFRPGKAPLNLVEKNVDQKLLQSEFLDAALNRLYVRALDEHKLRPVDQPQVNLTKFVPFTELEMVAEVEVVGEVKLPDYKTIKVKKQAVKITEKDVEDVIDNLKAKVADKTEVERAAKEGDEVIIDFAGEDAKNGEPINGADGKDYPLLLGSNSFIPGFETNLVGMKPAEDKTFDLTFPAEYGVKALQNRKVTFKVTVIKVLEVAEPKLDAAFAAKVGPFKSMEELRADIKEQVQQERELQAERAFQNDILDEIASKTKADIPEILIQNELDRMEQDERQNLVYRGQTWEEHLEAEGVTNEEHRERQREAATSRVTSGMMLAEIAEKESIKVTPEELEIRMQLLKGQYTDPAMQAELDKPEARRQIASRLLSEKTIKKLTDYASK